MRLGEDGLRLWRLAQGRDDRAVHAERETKSVSSETTFDRDISDKAELTRILLAQCDRVATRLRREALATRGITLKLRLADFSLRTRSRSGFRATQLAPRLFAAARPLLDAQPDGVAYRLLGIAATELEPAEGADEEDMFVRDSGREKTREAAIAALRDRFGPSAVQRGLTFRPASADQVSGSARGVRSYLVAAPSSGALSAATFSRIRREGIAELKPICRPSSAESRAYEGLRARRMRRSRA